MKYVDQYGRNVTLGEEIGSGGEGAVYEVLGKPDRVAKIYKHPASHEKAAKLAAMAGLATPDMLRVAAWPVGNLHRALGGATVGILMPRIKDSNEVHQLYSPTNRKTHFPKADWQFLIRAARNSAAALATLHGNRVVVGDFNQRNVLVSQHAFISLIDADSFQVEANGHLFRCAVGVPDFLPPELQGVNLTDVVRTYNHDNFALAVLIFQLLFLGRHPFAGRYSGSGDITIEKAIREHWFAYSSAASQFRMAPPPNSLTLAAIPQRIGLLFERAFAKGSEHRNARPTSLEWAQSLDQLEAQLSRCQEDSGHLYFASLRSCPWCDIARSGGPNFFISVTIQAVIARSASFDLASIWAQIQAVPRPDQAFTPARRFSTAGITPRPIPAWTDESRSMRNAVGIIAAASSVLTLLAIVALPAGVFFIVTCVIFAVWWLVLKMNSPAGQLKRERSNCHRQKLQELDRTRAHQSLTARKCLQQFQGQVDALRQLVGSYNQFKLQRDAEMQSLHQHVQQRQLEAHLRQFFVCDARIAGIGPLRIAALESNGIETAYDVTSLAVQSVPGFGEKMTDRLVSWRAQKEREFRFNPSHGVPQADIQALEMKYAQMRSQCERALERGPQELRHISRATRTEVERLDGILARLEFEAAQLKADLQVFDSIPWWY